MKPPNFWVGYPNPWASILFHYGQLGDFCLNWCLPNLWIEHQPLWASNLFLEKKRWSGQFWGFGFKWCFRKFEVQCLNICFVRLVFSSFGVVSHKFWFQLLPSKSLGLIPNNYILRIEISKKKNCQETLQNANPNDNLPKLWNQLSIFSFLWKRVGPDCMSADCSCGGCCYMQLCHYCQNAQTATNCRNLDIQMLEYLKLVCIFNSNVLNLSHDFHSLARGKWA